MDLNYIITVIKKFRLPEGKISVSEMGEGKIHETYKIIIEDHMDSFQYVLQKLNRKIFGNIDALMHNFSEVSSFLQDNEMMSLEIVPTKRGKLFYKKTNDSSYWRVTVFINSGKAFYNTPDTHYAYEAGLLLGKFHKLLTSFPKNRLKKHLPGFHQPSLYYQRLVKLVDSSNDLNEEFLRIFNFIKVRKSFLLKLEGLKNRKKICRFVCHYDPKFSNMLFDKDGKGICLVDLDTLTIGLLPYDFGDAVRSICRKTSNDNKIYKFSLPYFKSFSEGYLKVMRQFLSLNDIKFLFDGVKIIALELSIRYLTDYLSENKCFKIDDQSELLENAIRQIAWLEDAELQENKSLQALTDIYLKTT